jgi:hypothetical protein
MWALIEGDKLKQQYVVMSDHKGFLLKLKTTSSHSDGINTDTGAETGKFGPRPSPSPSIPIPDLFI